MLTTEIYCFRAVNPYTGKWELVLHKVIKLYIYFNILDLNFLQSKELYTGTPNSDMRILCTVHSGRNVNKPSAPIAVEGKGLNSDKQSDL